MESNNERQNANAVYRIVITHEPQYHAVAYTATIYRVSDDQQVGRCDGASHSEARLKAAEMCERLSSEPEAETTYFADAKGLTISA